MILSFGPNPQPDQIEQVEKALFDLHLEYETVACAGSTLIVVTSPSEHISHHLINLLPGVQKILQYATRTPLVFSGQRASLEVLANGGRLAIGGGEPPVVISGPCAVESLEQVLTLAPRVRAAGARALRGGAFKPRSSPYDFQGLGIDGLKYLKEAGLANQLPVVSEIMTLQHIEQAEPLIDVFQVGARNMYNYELLKELGRQNKPVLLKRGLSATIDEFLQAAEYILLGGNQQVILCERGIRTFETSTRNTLDLSAVAVLKSMSNLPVLVDPSHAAGKRHLIRPLSRAAIACGADGLMIECHMQPDKSYSDASQAITPDFLREIVEDMNVIAIALQKRDEQMPAVDKSGTSLDSDSAPEKAVTNMSQLSAFRSSG